MLACPAVLASASSCFLLCVRRTWQQPCNLCKTSELFISRQLTQGWKCIPSVHVRELGEVMGPHGFGGNALSLWQSQKQELRLEPWPWGWKLEEKGCLFLLWGQKFVQCFGSSLGLSKIWQGGQMAVFQADFDSLSSSCHLSFWKKSPGLATLIPSFPTSWTVSLFPCLVPFVGIVLWLKSSPWTVRGMNSKIQSYPSLCLGFGFG